MNNKYPFTDINVHLLPPPISLVLDNLVYEQRENGLHTTADETAEAIETWFRLLGALLLAEYLNSGAPDGNLNRWIFSQLSQPAKKTILSGTWVAIGRACHGELKKTWDKGLQPTWEGLKNIDLGSPVDKHHPVSRLTQYRNHFGHGSFAQVEDEIIEHGQLLEEQINILFDELAERPIRRVNPDNSVAILQGTEAGEYDYTVENSHAPDEIPALTAYVEMPDGSHRILAPALQLTRHEDGHWSLGHSQLEKSIDPVLLEQFDEMLKRYRREQAGHIVFGEKDIPPQAGTQDPAIAGIENALTSGNVLTLVHYRPGTGQNQLAASLLKLTSEQFAQAFVWRVIKDEHDSHPSARGSVFARALLRHAETALGLKEGELEINSNDLLSAVSHAGNELEQNNKQVACIIMDAEKGLSPLAPDTLSVIDTCKAASGGFRLILLANPSQTSKLPHDGATLMSQLPTAEQFDLDEMQSTMDQWLKEHSAIRVNTLQQMMSKGAQWEKQEEPLLMAVEDVETAMGSPLFAPTVEHALWTAAPFIETKRNEFQASYWAMPSGDDNTYRVHLAKLLQERASQGGKNQ